MLVLVFNRSYCYRFDEQATHCAYHAMPGISVHLRDETLDLSMQMGPVSLAALTRLAHLAAY